MILTEEQRRCRICGYSVWGQIWIDLRLPDGKCPDGAIGSPCGYAIARAEGEAYRRKVAPQCFDAHGVMIPGRGSEVWQAVFDDIERRKWIWE